MLIFVQTLFFTVVNDFTDSLIASGFKSLINIPTRITDYSATCIDHVFMNFRDECFSVVIEIKVSDHSAIFVSLRITKTKLNSHKKIQFRTVSWKKIGLVNQNVLKPFRLLNNFVLTTSLKYF